MLVRDIAAGITVLMDFARELLLLLRGVPSV